MAEVAGAPVQLDGTFTIGIVVVFFSDLAHLERCIESVVDSQISEFGRICVQIVDTSSDGGAFEFAQRWSMQVSYVHCPENLGYGWALNRGVIELGFCDFWILSNCDVEYSQSSIQTLVDVTRKTGGIVAPLQYEMRGSCCPHIDSVLAAVSVSDCISRWLWIGRRRLREKRLRLIRSYLRAVDEYHVLTSEFALSGAVLAFANPTLQIVGGMPTCTFLQEEDRILSFRALRLDVPLVISVQSRIVHFGGLRQGRGTPRRLQNQIESENAAWIEADIGPVWLIRLITSAGLAVRFVAQLPQIARTLRGGESELLDWVAAFRTSFRGDG